MAKSTFVKRQALTLIVLSLLAIALAALLAIGFVRTAREQERLEAEHSKHAATAPPAGSEGMPDDGRTRGYLRLAEGSGTLFLFGDEAIYGRGLCDVLGNPLPLVYNCESSFTSLALAELRAEYGAGLRANVIRDVVKTHTLTYAAEVVARLVESGTPPSIILLSVSDATRAAGLATDPAGYDFAKDLEGAVRSMRLYAPQADILLVIPTNADADTATAIAAVAGHYGLLTVDLAAALGTDPTLVHGAGEDAGYLTEAGHEAAAAAITEAVGLAVRESYTAPPLPEERLRSEERRVGKECGL